MLDFTFGNWVLFILLGSYLGFFSISSGRIILYCKPLLEKGAFTSKFFFKSLQGTKNTHKQRLIIQLKKNNMPVALLWVVSPTSELYNGLSSMDFASPSHQRQACSQAWWQTRLLKSPSHQNKGCMMWF